MKQTKNPELDQILLELIMLEKEIREINKTSCRCADETALLATRKNFLISKLQIKNIPELIYNLIDQKFLTLNIDLCQQKN